MKKIVGVRFKKPGKIYFFDRQDLEINIGDKVIVETENTVTVFIDSHYSYPIYISKNSIEKGSAEFFCNILKEKTADKYSVL